MIGIFMNTSSGIIEQRRTRRRDSFPLTAINKQLKEFETPNKDEGFDTLIIHKNYELPIESNLNTYAVL